MRQVIEIDDHQAKNVLSSTESHFLDFKAKDISPARLSENIAAFGNSDGGEIYVGVSEQAGTFVWDGFSKPEDANNIYHLVYNHFQNDDSIILELLSNKNQTGIVVKIEILKSPRIFKATNDEVYKRVNASKVKVTSPEQVRQIEFEKGLHSYEDNTTNDDLEEITNSKTIIEYMLNVVPTGEPIEWLKKEKLIRNEKCTVAGILLFSEAPQSSLSQCSTKIYRYKTIDTEGTRESLDGVPETIEGDLYTVISHSIDRTIQITEGIPILSSEHGFEKISYPREAIHEIICNAFIHRDYSVPDYVHIRIFDNRIEVQSPGRLPGHITERNILKERFIRNKKVTRLLNKFPNPPNQDVGEGLNTAFNAMKKLQLREPIIQQDDASVTVYLRHEKLASLEDRIAGFLMVNDRITNMRAREVFGEASESKVRKAFQAMREAGVLEVVDGTRGKGTAYQLTEKGRQQKQ